MSPPRYPRARSTPAPTVPPPEPLGEPADAPADAPARIAARIEIWKVLLAVALALVAGGAAWATVRLDVATKQDLAQEHAAAAGPVISLQTETQALRERMARVEAALVGIQDNVAFLRVQLIEVAKATGARAVPPPAVPPMSTP